MEDKKKRLIELLNKMNLPKGRIEKWDLRWLGRNMFILNGNHPDFNEAKRLLMEFCEPHYYLVLF